MAASLKDYHLRLRNVDSVDMKKIYFVNMTASLATITEIKKC